MADAPRELARFYLSEDDLEGRGITLEQGLLGELMIQLWRAANGTIHVAVLKREPKGGI